MGWGGDAGNLLGGEGGGDEWSEGGERGTG